MQINELKPISLCAPPPHVFMHLSQLYNVLWSSKGQQQNAKRYL